MQANIFKIEPASALSDSEKGIVIYFKGCPLRCSWCSKPQTKAHPTQIMWDNKRCLFCRLCANQCPSGSIQFDHNILKYNAETCTGCRECVVHCPSRMLLFVGKMMSLEEVMAVLEQNRAASPDNNRVILSGGDPLLQAKFAGELLKNCRSQGFHTTVETTGYANALDFSRLTAHTDLLYLEIKHYEEARHVQFTGVSNQTILTNLDFALARKLPLIVRISLIPNVNDSLTDAKKFAELLCKHHVTQTELIHFSMLGTRKYQNFQMPKLLTDNSRTGLTNLEDYAAVMRSFGLQVTVREA